MNQTLHAFSIYRNSTENITLLSASCIVVSGLLSSKVSACSLIIKDSAEARLGDNSNNRASLLKQNLTP